jgi:coenzyme Q-binding protein COQ10
MHRHAETRSLPYTPKQMFDLVADVGRYPEFLPWCLAARVTGREDGVLSADLVVGKGPFRETFTSKVTLDSGEGFG